MNPSASDFAARPETSGSLPVEQPQTGAEYLDSLDDGRVIYIYGPQPHTACIKGCEVAELKQLEILNSPRRWYDHPATMLMCQRALISDRLWLATGQRSQ
jgi:hypothetical protein